MDSSYQDYVLGAGHTYYFVFSSCIFEEESSGAFLFSEFVPESISLGAWTDVTMDSSNKLFTYIPSENGVYLYRVSENTTSLKIFDSNGNIVKDIDYCFYLLPLSLQAGEKYLFECGSQGWVTEYGFKLEKMNATALSLDSSVAYSGDYDNLPLFSFVPDHDGTYRFSAVDDSVFRLTLYDSNFNQVAATMCWSVREPLVYQMQNGTTWYIMISPEYGDTGQTFSGTMEATEMIPVEVTFDANRGDAWFEDENGSHVRTVHQMVSPGTQINQLEMAPPFTSNEDIYYDGWSKNSSAQEAGWEPINTDTTVYAIWKNYNHATFHTEYPNTYFEDENGNQSNTYQGKYRQYEGISQDDRLTLQSSDPSLQFMGWARELDGEVVNGYIDITQDMDIYAVWKPLRQVTFHADDTDACFEWTEWDSDMNEIIHKDPESVGSFPEGTVLSNVPYNNLKTDNNGKIFVGWAKTSKATAPDEITIGNSANLDVYAVWANAVTVTFQANHPSAYFYEYVEIDEWQQEERRVPFIQKSFAEGAVIDESNTMRPENDDWEYSFYGWSEDPNAPNPDSDIHAFDGMELYAVWQRSGDDPVMGELEAWAEGLERDPWTGGYLVNVLPNDEVTLTVCVDPDLQNPVSYEWYYGDYQVDPPTNTNTLTIRNIDKNSMIHCYVTDGVGEANVYFVVQVDNEFRAWPEGADVDPETGLEETTIKRGVSQGDSIDLTAEVHANDRNGLSYQWAIDVDPFENGESWETIQGVNTDTYNITVDGKKHLRCSITDRFGNSTAIFFLYYIENNFVAKAKEEELTIKPHESATFEVEASATDETKMSYQWYRWDRAPFLSDYTEIPGETGTTLTLTDMMYSDIIYCKVDDGFGNTEMVRFYVWIDNDFHAWPDGAKLKEEAGLYYRYLRVTVPYGGTADLTTLISGEDTSGVTYQWFLVDVEHKNFYRGIIADPQSTWAMDMVGITEMEGAIQNTYTTESITDAHQHICRVSDAFNSGDLVVFDVEVENGLEAWPEGAEFDEDSQTYSNRIDISAKQGDTVTLKANATATDTTDLRYHWYRCYEHEYYKYSYLLEDLNCYDDSLEWAFSENVMLCCDVTDCYGGQRKAFFNIQEETTPACIVTVTSAGGGINSTIAPVYGGGSYHKGDKVTVGASNVSGFAFAGWYLGDTLVSTELEYTFTVEEDTNLVARYQVNVGTTFSLKITGADFKVNGVPQNVSYMESFEAGTQVALEYYGSDDFLRWENNTSHPESTEKCLTLTMNKSYELKIITVRSFEGSEESGYYAFVEFVSPYDQIMKASVWTSKDDPTERSLPSGVSKSGYTFAGWSMDEEQEAGPKDIIDAIDAETQYIELRPLLEPVNETNTVTVYDAEGNPEIRTVNLGQSVTLEAGTVEDKIFKCWALDPDGKTPLSYSASYSFKVTADISVYAIYVSEEEDVTPLPVITTTGAYARIDAGVRKLFFLEVHDVPDGYTVVENGFLFGTSASAEFPDPETAEAKLFYGSENEAVKKSVSDKQANHGSHEFIGALKSNPDLCVYTKSYLVVIKNSTGEKQVYYGQFRYGTYDSLSNTED